MVVLGFFLTEVCSDYALYLGMWSLQDFNGKAEPFTKPLKQ